MRGEVSSSVAAGAAGGLGIVPCRAGCHAGGRRYIAPGVSGEVAEWLKALAWKACIRETVSWVRIPPSPPIHRSHLFADVRESPLKRALLALCLFSAVRGRSPATHNCLWVSHQVRVGQTLGGNWADSSWRSPENS